MSRRLSKRAALLMLAICALAGLAAVAFAQQEAQKVWGPVEIAGVTLSRVDAKAPITAAPEPKEDWQPPAPTEAEKAAALIPYTRAEPGDFRPWSVPRSSPAERVTALRAFATPGQTEAMWFAVYALEDLQRVALSVAPKGGAAADVQVEVRLAHFWPQRTDWRSSEYYVTPELLVPCADGEAWAPAPEWVLEKRPLNVRAGRTALFWLTLRIADNTTPGDATLEVSISSQGKAPLALPLTVHVYPFRLEKPADRRWLLYGDVGFWASANPALARETFADIAAHGMDGLTELPFGRLDLSGIAEGKVEYDPEPFLNIVRQASAAGLKGPYTIGNMVEAEVVSRLGLSVNLDKDKWPPALTEAVQKVAETVTERLKAEGVDWLYYAWDEPGPQNTYALQDYECWHRGGAKPYVTFYDLGTYEAAAGAMEAPCFSIGLVASRQACESALKACGRHGQRYYWYGSGCYIGQEGKMLPNRFLSGFFFRKTGAQGQVSWTFIRPHEDPFNDFDGLGANSAEPKDQCIVHPWYERAGDASSCKALIPTIQWEALREGIDDYRYLYTLERLIERCKQSERAGAKKAAKDAEGMLASLLEAIPWEEEARAAGLDNGHLQRTRRAIGDMAEALADLEQGREAPTALLEEALGGIGEARVTVQFVGPARMSEAPLPSMVVREAKVAPVIDGRLDDACWAKAGKAADFVRSESGERAPVQSVGRVCFDDKAVYLGMGCLEPRPQGIVVEHHGRDVDQVWLDDSVEIYLALLEDRWHYAHFVVNAGGALYDETVSAQPWGRRTSDRTWDPEVQVATSIGREAWYLEMAVPWSALPFGKKGAPAALALNLCRNRPEGSDVYESAWSVTEPGFHTPSRFGSGFLWRGDVGLTGVSVPNLWGVQNLKVTVANRGTDSQVASLTAGRQRVDRTVGAGSSETLVVSLPLLRAGVRRVPIEVATDGRTLWSAELSIPVPPPLEVLGPARFVEAGQEALIRAVVNIAPEAQKEYSVEVGLTDPFGRRIVRRLPARPGEEWSKEVWLAPFVTRVDLQLLHGATKRGEPVQARLIAIP